MLQLSTDDSLVVLLVKELYKRIVGHVVSGLYKAFPLEFDVALLRQELLVERLLGLDRCANFVWVEVTHVRKAFSCKLLLCLLHWVDVLLLGRVMHEALIAFEFRVQYLRISLVVLFDQSRAKKLFNRFDSSEFQRTHLILVLIVLELG